jgi:hypothetical protein
MNKKAGLFILFGLAIGASFGVFIGAALENTGLGVACGSIGGVFIGWLAAAAVLEHEKSNKSK